MINCGSVRFDLQLRPLIFCLNVCHLAQTCVHNLHQAITWKAFFRIVSQVTIAIAWRKTKRIVHRPDDNKTPTTWKCVAPIPALIAYTRLQFFPSQKLIGRVAQKKDCSHCLASWDSQLYIMLFLVVYGVHVGCIRSVFLIYKDVHFLKLNHSKIYWS